MDRHERVNSQSRRAYPLKSFLLPVILPLMLIIFGSIVLSISMRWDVRDYAARLKQETLSSLLTTQRTVSDLQTLGGSFHELIYTTDATHARLSYVKAWSILSDSTLQQFESTKPVTSRLFNHLHDMWLLRQQYDSKRKNANALWDRIFTNWLGLVSLTGKSDKVPVEIYGTTTRVTMRHLEPTSVHLKNLLALEESFMEFCARGSTDITADVNSFSEHCKNLQGALDELKTMIIELENIRNLYLKRVQQLESDADILNREFAILESKDLLQRINQINSIY